MEARPCPLAQPRLYSRYLGICVTSSSRFGALDDGGPFHLPIPGLFVDLEARAASVALPNQFLEASPATRAEILQQWLLELSLYRNAAIVELFEEFARSRSEMTAVEQTRAFREQCYQQGIDCPSSVRLRPRCRKSQ